MNLSILPKKLIALIPFPKYSSPFGFPENVIQYDADERGFCCAWTTAAPLVAWRRTLRIQPNWQHFEDPSELISAMLLRHDVDHLILDPLSPSPDMISEGILVESKFRIQSIPLEERVCLSVAENAVPIVLSYLQAIGIPASVSTIPTRLCEEYPTLSAHGLFRECVNLLTKSKVKELVDLGYFDGLWDGWAQSLASVQVEAAEIELVKGRLLEGSDGIFVHTLLLRQ